MSGELLHHPFVARTPSCQLQDVPKWAKMAKLLFHNMLGNYCTHDHRPDLNELRPKLALGEAAIDTLWRFAAAASTGFGASLA